MTRTSVPIRTSHARRAGVTLVELLVVVTIAVILVASAVPLMKPALRDGQLREAARQINTYFAIAKSRAMQHGRGAGVLIQRAEPGSNAAFELFIAETPPLYSGDFIGATAALEDNWPKDSMGNTIPDGIYESAAFTDSNSATLTKLVNVGDLVQFNYQGPWYEITLVTTVSRIVPPSTTAVPFPFIRFQPKAADAAGWPSLAVSVPFKIVRRPRKSSGTALQLGGGVVIDLEYSGIGATGQQFDANLTNNLTPTPPILNGDPVLIMFDGNGALSRIYGTAVLGSTSPVTYFRPGAGTAPTGTVHLLVGRFEQTGTTGEITNLQDAKNVWVSIGDRTGTVTSAENLAATGIGASRELARSGQSIGGK